MKEKLLFFRNLSKPAENLAKFIGFSTIDPPCPLEQHENHEKSESVSSPSHFSEAASVFIFLFFFSGIPFSFSLVFSSVLNSFLPYNGGAPRKVLGSNAKSEISLKILVFYQAQIVHFFAPT